MTISKLIFWKQEILVAVGHSSWKFQVDGVEDMLLIPDLNEAIVYELKELSGTGFKKYVLAFNIDRDIMGTNWSITRLISEKSSR